MTFITAAPDSKDSTAIYCLELFDREEVLQLSGEWTEELRYHSQAEELGRFSGKRWRLPWKWEVSSSTLFQNISNMHRTDASLTDLDTVVYIYSFTIDADYTHIYIYINIYYYIHNYIWYMYMIVCKCSFSIPSDHWQAQSSIGAMLAFLRVTQRSSRTLERMPERVATRYLNQARGAMAWQEDFEIFCTGGTLASCVCGHFCCVMILQNFPCISCIVVMQCSLLTIAKLPGGSDSL